MVKRISMFICAFTVSSCNPLIQVDIDEALNNEPRLLFEDDFEGYTNGAPLAATSSNWTVLP